ncbi:hypothetical protein [Paenibacillus methanolicus]|uniref:Dihydroorotate dehydrogenase n=1 Tax=Paenibacillus methanolicus TaxID=582686 RepID=A0A5S5BTB0_9BACL|nr:hypothetical protein [Paenibacillus methanolicus]TYP69380.1 dihydroorotate dehydrogenase [Paenibacillus methanolicus]
MPDWSYQTLFRPLLFRLPARVARGLTLRAMGTVSRMPGGTLLIKALGHMEPAPLLATTFAGIRLATPVGLSGAVDPEHLATRALAQLGFGFVEAGPITPRPIRHAAPIRLDVEEEAIVYPSAYENEGAEAALRRMRAPDHALPQFARLAPSPDADRVQAIEELGALLDMFGGEHSVAALVIEGVSAARSRDDNVHMASRLTAYLTGPNRSKPCLLYVPLDFPDEWLTELLQTADSSVWSGFVIGDAIGGKEGATVGRDGKSACLAKVALVRSQAAGSPALLASAGVHAPVDALELMDAGADYVLLHGGFVFAGPGLPKRVNEVVQHRKLAELPGGEADPPFWRNWGWMCLLGIGMIIGGLIAWHIATSTVLLSYDEDFLGMTGSEVSAIAPHLLHFMSHDRITLAGTMISIGILYYRLAKHGLRHGLHWAKTAVLVSGAVGFPSFFLYLGYGFFDPLHAAAAAILLPMFLLSMRRNPDRPYRDPVNLRNDKTWKRSLWGQLCFIVVGISLCVGGIVIATVGVTNVFVPQDLRYLGLTRETLDLANPRLVPLIAHDRAGFGGALLADAVMILILALWGLQQGARWLWWTLLAGGAPGFLAGLGIHLSIGYTDFVHLLPAYFVFALYVAGLILLYPYLMKSEDAAVPLADEGEMPVQRGEVPVGRKLD